MLELKTENLKDFISEADWEKIKPELKTAWQNLSLKKGAGKEFLGWLELPQEMQSELPALQETALKIQEQSQILVSLGVGGSYLGAKAGISALGNPSSTQILFAGNNLSPAYLQAIIAQLKNRDFSLLCSSKSGFTLETSLAFHILQEILKQRYGAKAEQRIYLITDPEKGVLRELARKNNYPSFAIPPGVGGRFSVLSPVGLLPMAVAGIAVEELLEGALKIAELCQKPDPDSNLPLYYAGVRNILYRKDKIIEIFSFFEPKLHYLGEWLKQLWGESEGKEGKGIFPAACLFTTDLHSLGQLIQQGSRNLLETFIWIEKTSKDLIIPEGLEQFSGKSLAYLNKIAYLSAAKAHKEGGVPNLSLVLDELKTVTLGAAFYFFELAVSLSGYLLGVNPFDQPGVEAYKSNIKQLLKTSA